jgi:PAS domain S-box-containing protein
MAKPPARAASGRATGSHAELRLYVPLLDSIIEGALVVDTRGLVVAANEAAASIFGVPRDGLLASLETYPDRFAVRTPAGDRAMPVAAQALRGEVVHPVEQTIRTPRGVEKQLRTSAAPIRDESGIIGAIALMSDVSAAKADEQRALHDTRALKAALAERDAAATELQTVLDAAPVAVFITRDPDSRRITGNRYAANALRMPRGANVSMSAPAEERQPLGMKIVRGGEEVPPDMMPVQKAARGTPVRDWECDFVFADGSVRHMIGSAEPLVAPDGAPRGAVGAFLDITERKRTEDALRESETLYRLLFSLAPSGVVLNDADGRILAFNDRAHEQLGYTRGEFGRMSIADIDADEEPEDVRRHVAEIARSGGAEYEVHHRAKSGEIRIVLVKTRRIDVGGERRFLNVWQDITDRKRAEEALREIDKRKSEFLAVLSHELRNPLAPIRNSIYLLDRAAPGSPQAAQAREVILRQTEQLSRLVDDLLDVTRISRGKVTLNRARVDLRDVARRTCEDHRSLFEGSAVELRVEAPVAPVWIDADVTRISQVLGNLLQNAVKFTPSGGAVTVGVRARVDQAELSVRDTGVGMKPDQVERMFEPFAQAEQGLARTTGGLGLGLALVKGLVELHGGSVQARSEGQGRGSEFVVSLPLALGPGADLEAAPAIAPRAPTRQVLVIEDNVDAGMVLAAVLELNGHLVRVARDGRSGIAMARELKPDVVVCDIGLPDVDGYEVARALRSDEGFRSTRLIAISGYAQPEDKERAKDAGFDAHLAKPASIDELNALLAGQGPAGS